MYRRFKESITKPSLLILYLKDSRLMTWMYFFLLCILTLIPVTLKISLRNPFDNQTYQSLSNVTQTLHMPYEIVGGKLIADEDSRGLIEEVTFGAYRIYFSKSKEDLLSSPTFYYIFQEEGISLNFYEFELSYQSYETLGIENQKLKHMTFAEQQQFIGMILQVYNHKGTFIKSVDLFITIIDHIGGLAFAILIVTAFNTRPIAFKYKFKINVYASTVYALSFMFADLFGVPFLTWIGILLFFILSARAFSRLIGIKE